MIRIRKAKKKRDSVFFRVVSCTPVWKFVYCAIVVKTGKL